MTGITKRGKYRIRRELGEGARGVGCEGCDPAVERGGALSAR